MVPTSPEEILEYLMPDSVPSSPSGIQEQEAEWRDAEGERLLVVGIGASAGGLEAFEQFLRGLSPDTGFAYVLAQHLDPQHESLLAEILARATSIPVEFAKHGQRIERDHVYVMPRDAGLLVDGGKLSLDPADPRGNRQPINVFLKSLAEDQRENAVGIVLSGTGSDGALGIAAVRRNGGATFAQLPSDARYQSMPQAAIATGMVDRVLPVAEIAAAMAGLATHRREHPGESARGELEGLRELFDLLFTRAQHDFSQYKRSTILRRVHRRMASTSTTTLREYVALLGGDEGEVHRLKDDLMINVTSFFRDGAPFDVLERLVIPDIMQRDAAGDVRAWVAGCSSGEEAYTIAMLLREQAERVPMPRKMQVFATDIDSSALAEARRGQYSNTVERQLSPERLARFFVRRGDSYAVTKDVRDLCLFTEHDLLRAPPFSRLDLVSCRNLLIYLEPHLQKRVIELFHYALRPGGYLLLGKAEVVGEREQLDLFDVVDKTARLFRRRPGERRPGVASHGSPSAARPPPQLAPLSRRSTPEVRSAADRSWGILLEEYAPPSVVVDGSGEIRYYWGANLASYLPPQPGPPATNLMHLVRPELKVELAGVLHNAARHSHPVTHRDVALKVDGIARVLDLVVRPLPPSVEDPDELYLVIFRERHAAPPDTESTGLEAPTLERYRQVEAELENARGRLQTTVDELESANEALHSSNEQLQSLNEELHSSNEELQTSQEELQSVNEELNTVNAELSKKVDELELLYGDLNNLFLSTRIATIFLDRNFRIARFTPEAVSIFRLADGDVGRPLADFAARFDAEGVEGEVQSVLQTLVSLERAVQMVESGRWFLMRMNPYRTPSNVIAGVVISFVDITELKAAEAALREAVAERERAEQSLLDADRRKDEFLAVLSHELRNPLAPIRNSVHILEHSGKGSAAAERARDIIGRQVGHLARLVDDLLDVTRVARGKLQVQLHRVNLRDLVAHTADDHRTLFGARGVKLDVALPDQPLWVDGDSTRLAQVVGNLLQNAAKFTPSGGSVSLSLSAVDAAVELRVKDTGSGIDAVMLPRLFQPFSQADATMDRRLGGLGLGLALVKGLVELHAGTVGARSGGRNSGSEFVVRLPRAEAPAVTRDATPVARPNARRILVVEDNTDGAESLREVLAMDGHSVEVAHDGPRGLEKAREFVPELVVCDIGLPGLDGYEVARAIRKDSALRGVFLIALTGYALPEDQRRASDAGFDTHLSKPTTVERIREAIARAPAGGPVLEPAK
jgi:two-component system CheB/CheR fusion protein